jgi:hypothetical protein
MPRHEIRLTASQEADLLRQFSDAESVNAAIYLKLGVTPPQRGRPEGVIETKPRKPASKGRGPDKRKRKTRSDAGRPRKSTNETKEKPAMYQAGITLRKPNAPAHDPFTEELVGAQQVDLTRAKIMARTIFAREPYAVNGFVEDSDGVRVWSTEEERGE